MMPEQFGRYQLRALLGEGGFARVYRAYDPSLGREVALKTLLPWRANDDDTRARFLAEARAIAALNHRNIVTVYDVGAEGGLPFFAMELIEGRTLARLIADDGPQPLARVIDVMRQLGAAVDFLHQRGVVHRDIKPANIMIDGDGRPVLMDFGIARSGDAGVHTQTGASLGTPLYMSPEQVRGQVAGPPADVYALGVVAYQLLAGRPPFEGDTAHVLHAQVYDPPPPLTALRPELPPHVFQALLLALAKDPAQRPRAAALAALLAGDDTPTQHLTPPPVPPDLVATRLAEPAGGRSRGVLLAIVGAVLLLALGGGVAALALRGNSATNTPATPPSTRVASASATATASATAALPVGSATAPATAAPSASATAKPASATATAPPFLTTFGKLDDTSAWADGKAPWNATVSYQNAPAGAALVLRVLVGSPGNGFVAQSAQTPLSAPEGTVTLTVPASGVLVAGNYVAQLNLVQNGTWTEQARRGITVAAAQPTTPPTQPPTQPPTKAPTQATQPPPQSGVGGTFTLTDYVRYGNGAGDQTSWTVTLTPQGSNVSGRAVLNSDSSAVITLSGQLSSGVLHLHYQSPGRTGEFWWQFTADNNHFEGAFSAIQGGSDYDGGTSYGVRQGVGGAAPALAVVYVVGANAPDGIVTRGQTVYVCYTASAKSTITLTTTPHDPAAELTNADEDGTGDCLPDVPVAGSDGLAHYSIVMKVNGATVASGSAVVGFH